MDKWLDKLMDNRNFMKLVALVMAFLLFGSIYDSNNATNDINIPGEQDTETIEDIPIKSYYDTDNLVITGVPQTAKVTLKGPKPNLQNAKAQKEFEVYADLSKAKVGSQRVKLQIRNVSEKLTATIEPKFVEVKVQEKITKEFPVTVEFNEEVVAEGFKAEPPIVKPGKVKITGGKEDIDSISFVKAIVDTKDQLNSTFDKSLPVYALDGNLKQLNVTLERATVRVTIPIKLANKTVPIEIVKNGTSPDGVMIDSIVLDKKEALISGSEEALKATENVRVEVDVSAISKNTEMPLPIIIPEGIKEADPKTVKATIKVIFDSEEAVTTNVTTTKAFSNLPININGLSEGYSLSFQDPPGGKTSLTVTGTSEEIDKIVESNFQLSLDAANLTEGEQEVEIQVSGPEKIEWSIPNKKARIIVQAKKVNDEETETPQNE